MERKIGEIFEYNGEWYQCVKGNTCDECSFSKSSWNCLFDGTPYCSDRSDGIEAIFKKLKKVGEPCGYFVQGVGIIMVQEYIIYNSIYTRDAIQNLYIFDCQNGRIAIEIKQNKEDMEEKKIILNQEDLTYLIGKIRCDILPKHTTYDEITEEIAKMFIPVNDTELSNLENAGKNLKPFDLEAARSGKPVCTRDGRKARIICFDAKRKDEKSIIALVPSKDYLGFEDLIAYPDNGNYYGGHENDADLMMLPEKHDGWVNLRKEAYGDDIVALGKIYKSHEEAVTAAKGMDRYIASVKIEWEK